MRQSAATASRKSASCQRSPSTCADTGSSRSNIRDQVASAVRSAPFPAVLIQDDSGPAQLLALPTGERVPEPTMLGRGRLGSRTDTADTDVTRAG